MYFTYALYTLCASVPVMQLNCLGTVTAGRRTLEKVIQLDGRGVFIESRSGRLGSDVAVSSHGFHAGVARRAGLRWLVPLHRRRNVSAVGGVWVGELNDHEHVQETAGVRPGKDPEKGSFASLIT